MVGIPQNFGIYSEILRYSDSFLNQQTDTLLDDNTTHHIL